jgi:hypothetical protein
VKNPSGSRTLRVLAAALATFGIVGSVYTGYLWAVFVRSGWDVLGIIGLGGSSVLAAWAMYLIDRDRGNEAARLLAVAVALGVSTTVLSMVSLGTPEGHGLLQASRVMGMLTWLIGVPLLCFGLAGLLARFSGRPPSDSS